MICSLDSDYTVPKRHGHTYKLHYMFLSGEERRIYKAIFDAIEAHENRLVFGKAIDTNQLWRIFLEVLADNPTLFWVEKGVRFSVSQRETVLILKYIFKASDVAEYKKRMTRKIEEIYNECVPGCKCDMDLVVSVHDYITRNVLYVNDGNPEQQSMVGPLMFGKGVCEGISFLYSYILNVFGINCTTIYGRIEGEENGHAWNMVFLDGQGYHVDVTHDLECSTYRGNHIHLNLTDEEIGRNRTWEHPVRCGATIYNYYSYNGYQFKGFKEVCEYIRSCLKAKKMEFEFRIVPSPPRDTVMKQINDYIVKIAKDYSFGWSGMLDVYYMKFDRIRLK